MKNKNILILLLLLPWSLKGATEHIKEVMAPLCSRPEVLLVTVDGVSSNQQGSLEDCSCSTLKKEQLPSAAVAAWYEAFAECRHKERHEWLRLAARFLLPTAAGTAVYAALQEYSPYIKLPGALMVFWALSSKGKLLFKAMNEYLDSRADRAALQKCLSEGDKLAVLAHLEAAAAKGSESKADLSGQYELLHVNAYDKAQSSHCSYISISLAIPLSWLFSAEPSEKLQARIRAVRASLLPH